MSKKVKIILIALGLILCAVVAVFFLLNPGHLPENNNLQLTIKSVQDSGKNNIEAVWCKKCHIKIDSVKTTGMHTTLNCQYCHGPADKHTRNPQRFVLNVNPSKAFCLKCHDISNVASSRPKHQVDSLKHNPNSSQCITCHNPHSPLLTVAISKFGATKQVSASACEICHQNINKIRMQGNHKSIGCQTCHGQGNEHILSATHKNINKPQSREFCGKCHATGKPSGNIKQIDLKEHNDGMKCVECHLAHNPLEFK